MKSFMRNSRGRIATSFAVFLTALTLAACSGGGGGSGGTVAPPPPLPTATLSSIAPATGETGVARTVNPVITLAVTNATSSNASGLSLACTSGTISFTAASALSTDAKSMTVTLTPQTNALVPGDACTLTGDISTTGTGGTVKTTISASFTVYAAKVATGLSLIAGTFDSPGSTNGPRLSASFYTPKGFSKDAQGNIYVVDGCTGQFESHALIRKISPAGDVTSVAGNKSYGGIAQDGVTNHRCMWAVAPHPDGNLYSFDSMNSVVWKITPQGVMSIFAGAAGQKGSTDGSATMARFEQWPGGIAADQQGNLFVADNNNSTIRKIDLLGNVTTYAGLAGVVGSADGSLQNARFQYPIALKFGGDGKLYVGDQNGIRVISNGTVSTVIPQSQTMKDICGPGSANLTPGGIDISDDGRIAVSYDNCRSVGIYKNNQLSVLIGSYSKAGDSDGTPSTSQFFFPEGVAFLSNGDLLISDGGNHNIKLYSASTNSVILYAGQRLFPDGIDGVGSAAKLYNPWSLHLAPSGDIWFTQGTVSKSSASGNVMSFANTTNEVNVLKVNHDGSFIATGRGEWTSNSYPSAIKLYSQTGAVLTTLATLSDDIPFPFYSAVGANGDIFFTNKTGGIRKYASGVVTEFAQPIPSACCGLNGLAVTKAGEIIAAGNGAIYKVTTAGISTPLTTSQDSWGYQDGPMGNAKFSYIQGLAAGMDGAIYVNDKGNSVIRRIYNGNVDTIIGTLWVDEVVLGMGMGGIYSARGLAFDEASNSLIILTGNAILRAQLP